MSSWREIVRKLAETLNVEATKKALGVSDDELRAALLAACEAEDVIHDMEQEVSRAAEPVGPGLLTIYVDGASRGNPGPAGAGMVLTKDGRVLEAQGQYLGRATNNQAEYQALIMALERALALAATEVEIFSDSELLVRQIKGSYRVKNQALKLLWDKAQELIARLDKFRIQHIPRELNQEADTMATRAIDEFA